MCGRRLTGRCLAVKETVKDVLLSIKNPKKRKKPKKTKKKSLGGGRGGERDFCVFFPLRAGKMRQAEAEGARAAEGAEGAGSGSREREQEQSEKGAGRAVIGRVVGVEPAPGRW